MNSLFSGLTHFQALALFSLAVSLTFAFLSKRGALERAKYFAWAFLAFLLVAIAKRRLKLPQSLWEILQIVSVASMEQIALSELIVVIDSKTETVCDFKQLEINYS